MVSDHARRDHLIAQVSSGAMTPSEAEAEAARMGLMALEYRPDPREFDPMRERFWTLPMAVAWIAYRTVSDVTENYYAYMAECRFWIPAAQLGAHVPSGFELVGSHFNSINRMELVEEGQQLKDRNFLMPVVQAKQTLWQALRSAAVSASGTDPVSGRRMLIDALQFQDLTLSEMNHQDVFRTRAPIGIGPIRYANITVPMVEVRDHWRVLLPAVRPGRPPKMPPIKAEFDRRCQNGLVKQSLAKEAIFLASWFQETYPEKEAISTSTIENGLRYDFQSYARSQNK